MLFIWKGDNFQLKQYKIGEQNIQLTGFHFLAFGSKHWMEKWNYKQKNILSFAR